MWIQAQTETNLKLIDLGVFDTGPDVKVRFSENNTANVEEEVGAWLIEHFSGYDITEYEDTNE